VYQDDSAQTESKIDAASQRFIVSFPSSGTYDGLNRTLLRFSNGVEVWYVRLYSQADTRAGFQQSDGAASALTATARVGERILPPSADYSIAGHIELGNGFSDSYYAAGYIDPLVAGVAAAEPALDSLRGPDVALGNLADLAGTQSMLEQAGLL